MQDPKEITLLGFPEVHDKAQELNLPELLFSPNIMMASPEDVYRYGSDIQKKMIDLVPLKNNRKYVSVISHIQLLNPNVKTIKFLDHWHLDGNGNIFTCNDLIHILISDCTAKTEFNLHDIVVNLPEKATYNDSLTQYLNTNADQLGFIPKSIEPNKFFTFTSKHPHRAVQPLKREFRFIFRVTESNVRTPRTAEESIKNTSYVFEGDKKYPNIELTHNGIFIYKPDSFN